MIIVRNPPKLTHHHHRNFLCPYRKARKLIFGMQPYLDLTKKKYSGFTPSPNSPILIEPNKKYEENMSHHCSHQNFPG
jgi:hypothetical protein